MTGVVDGSGSLTPVLATRAAAASPRRRDALLTAGLVVSALVWLWAGRQPASCRRFQYGASFAGEQQRFAAWVTEQPPGCRADTASVVPWLVLAAVAALAFGVLASLALYAWWPSSGSSWTERARPVSWLPVGVAVLDVAQRLVVAVAVLLGDASAPRLAAGAAWLAPAFAWPKAVGVALTVAALVVVRYLGARRERFRLVASEGEDAQPTGMPHGLGICCSGGGIRAGSVALGVLSVLEEADPPAPVVPDGRSVLQRARYVASVSGGGYTSGAWHVATGSPGWDGVVAGAAPPRVIGPTTVEAPPPRLYDDDPAVAAGQSLYRHVETRQQFLRTGPGGMARSVLWVVGFFAFHLLVLATALVLAAWPAGRVARSWYVFGGVGCTAAADLPAGICDPPPTGATASAEACRTLGAGDDPLLSGTLGRTRCFLRADGRQHALHAAQVAPLVVFGTAGVVVLGLSLPMRRTQKRAAVRTVGSLFVLVAAGTALYAIGLPWLLDVVYPLLRRGPGPLVVAVTGLAGFAGVVYRAMVHALSRRLVFVSGYLVLGVGVLFGVLVAGNAAAREGAFGLTNHWLAEHGGSVLGADAFLYFVALVTVAAVFSQLQPRSWSLHTVYRARLRDAFATTTDAAKAAPWVHASPVEGSSPVVWPVDPRKEPSLDEFASGTDEAEATGPVHLVCCTAARRPQTGTGIKGESFVFSPYDVRLYVSEEGGVVTTYRARTHDYVSVLPEKLRGESMVVALSGAAVAPAMGRMTRGTFGTLLAVLNIRLGVWMPNPSLVPRAPDGPTPRRARPYPRAGVGSLAKEVVGAWSSRDDHLYLTDGGHWDNLGLVELLRRRCRTIVCVDASGDTPGSFATLRQAAQLAALQAHATIDTPEPVQPGAPLPECDHLLLGVTYDGPHGASTGTIVYLPARLWAKADLHLRAFAAEDPEFPWYSTGNQLLTLRRFRHLVALGRCAAEQALDDPAVREALAAGLTASAP